jgi:hypothetical protein
MTTDQPTPTPVKKPRAARRVSILFASLEEGGHFYLTEKQRAVKTSFCTARPYAKAALDAVQWGKRSPWQFVNPFRSVFVDRPKESAFLKAWTGILRCDPFPKGAGETLRPSLLGPVGVAGPVGPDDSALANSGRTHYVGDGCPGGHADAGRPTPDITGPTR